MESNQSVRWRLFSKSRKTEVAVGSNKPKILIGLSWLHRRLYFNSDVVQLLLPNFVRVSKLFFELRQPVAAVVINSRKSHRPHYVREGDAEQHRLFSMKAVSAQVVSCCVYDNPAKICCRCMATFHTCWQSAQSIWLSRSTSKDLHG